MEEKIKKENNLTSLEEKITNLEILINKSEESLNGLKKDMSLIKRHMRIRMIMGVLWLIIIIMPAIFAFFYLPSFLDQYFSPILEIYNKF